MTDVVFAWSGGKDSMLALHEIVRSGTVRVAALLTNVTRDDDRVSTHGVRRVLLERQAASLGIPLHTVELPPNPADGEYRARMAEALGAFRERGIDTVVHGDIFLADVREYREALLAGIGMRALFPLWGADTRELADRFLDLGYRAVLTCVDTHALDPALTGRAYDRALLSELPPGVDPCGENGEFHTLVVAGPMLREPLAVRPAGTLLVGDRFVVADLVEAPAP